MVEHKLRVLADAAKYDASCAGGSSRPAANAEPLGVSRTWGSEGRAVPLLRILLTNHCIHDCSYCVNRVGNDVPRAAFTPAEVATLTMDYFRKGYVHGLFLSSGVIRNADYTMEQMIESARILREEESFGGYIHLKALPGVSPELLSKAGRYANRLSANIELPRDSDLVQLAPGRSHREAELSMDTIRGGVLGARDRKRWNGAKPFFAPSGQTTQMIVGASSASDRDVLLKSTELYEKFDLRRVYYSNYIGPSAPPAIREHRLYQADWLIRLYEFPLDDVVTEEDGNLSLEYDPKLAWALRHREFFPVDVNAASREALLRVPGLGVKNAGRILKIRRFHKVTMEDLRRLRVSTKKAMPFLIAADDWGGVDTESLGARLRRASQLELFDAAAAARTGEF